MDPILAPESCYQGNLAAATIFAWNRNAVSILCDGCGGGGEGDDNDYDFDDGIFMISSSSPKC